MSWSDLSGLRPGPKKKTKKKATKKKVAKKRRTKKKVATRPSVRRRRKSPALKRGLIKHVEPYWDAIQEACAKSLKQKVGGFLPHPIEQGILGCGFWGCVWRTADKRFVLKASLDITEGPHVALAMKLFQRHPGVAYFHRLWKLPRVWTNEQGNTSVWIMLREETDVDSIWNGAKPAPGYKSVHDALEALPECCSCISQERAYEKRTNGCGAGDRVAAERELASILRRLHTKKGSHVSDLIGSVYHKHGVLLGDVHMANVGLRRHDLSEFGVKRHKQLVVTDLGDLGQAPIRRGNYPEIKMLKNPSAYARLADEIPFL